MSEAPHQPSSPSSATTWAACIFLMLLGYALSIGPVAYLIFRDLVHEPVGGQLVALYSPVLWLRDHTVLQDSINTYLEWWDYLAQRP